MLPDCTLPDHPEVFAIGDMISLDRLPGVAEVAMQQGLYAAKTIRRRVAGRHDMPPFKYRDLGSVATVGRFRAVVSMHGLRLGGVVGWLAWGFIHITFLTGFANRFSALLHWMRHAARARPQPARLQRPLHAPVAPALSRDARVASRPDLAWRHCDQVPAPTSSFQVALYVGSEILVPLNTSGWNT